MKINKKLLILGTAIASVVAPVATVVSCSFSIGRHSSKSTTKNDDNIIHNLTPLTPAMSNLVPSTITPGPLTPAMANLTPAKAKPSPLTPTNPTILDLSNYKLFSSFNEKTGTLTIEKGITGISNVFENGYIPNPTNPKQTETIKAINLPSTLKTIDNYAFESAQLQKLTIPNSVTTIGDWAFNESSMTSLTLGSSVTKIGAHAFGGALLTSLNIPNSVTTIADNAFGYSQLTSLTLGSSLKTIGAQAFIDSRLSTLTIPDGVTNIGSDAFEYSPWTYLVIPDSIYGASLIGYGAFANVVNQSSTFVSLPDILRNNTYRIFHDSSNVHFYWT